MEIVVAEKKRGMRNFFCDVPEGCIASIISITTPIDACRFAVVSRDFLLASKSDVVWERFLPSDYELIVTRSDGGEALLTEFQNKKKHLYMRLADRHRPLLVDAASKCFWLEKSSGKKCWRIAARSLSIAWSDHPYLWKWTSLPESRFPEVAELLYSQWIDIRGKINSSILSQDTQYAAYLIFNTVGETVGLHYPCEASVSIVGSETTTRTVYFGDDYKEIRKSRWGMMHPRPETKPDQIPRPRTDGWLELKIGELFTYAVEEDDEVEFSVIQIEGMNGKKGLIVEGIEVRPVKILT